MFNESLYRREYYLKNKDVIKERSRIRYLEKRTQILKQKKLYREKNKEKIKIKLADWYQKNKEEQKCKVKLYRENNKESLDEKKKVYVSQNMESVRKRQRAWRRKAYKDNIHYKLSVITRSRLRVALKKRQLTGQTIKLLGCSIDNLEIYLESRFTDDMSWDNHGMYGWHIDHKIPLNSFDLSDGEQLKLACHYTNLQPLWCTDNWKKKDQLI